MRRIIYDGDSFYELDEECVKRKEEQERRKETDWQRNRKNHRPGEERGRKSV